MTDLPDPNDENAAYVDAETWDWLQKRLAEPPKPNEKLIKLMRDTRGTVEHRD